MRWYPRALVDHPCCVPDELMRAVAATGGVLGISGIGILVGSHALKQKILAAESVLQTVK